MRETRAYIQCLFAVGAWLGCRRTPTLDIAPVASTSSSTLAPSAFASGPPQMATLGRAVRLVGTPWGACVLTTTREVWCFSGLTRGAKTVSELHDVVLVEGSTFQDRDLDRDPTVSCEAATLCWVTSSRALECTSNASSPSLKMLVGPVVDGKRRPVELTACSGMPKGVLAAGVQWIGPIMAPIRDNRGEMCSDGLMMFREGLLVGLATEAIIIPAVRRTNSTCCKGNLGGTYGPKCEAKGDRCSFPYVDGAPTAWHFGVGRMSDGSFRYPPMGASEEVKPLRSSTAVAYDSYVACALDAAGAVQCSNEPYDGPCADGSPGYRKWHRVAGLGTASAVLVTTGAAGGIVACALVEGRPWCWGTDGPDDATSPSALGLLGVGKLDRCAVKTGNTTTQHFCRRTPAPVEGVRDLVELVSMGSPRWLGGSGGGICGRTVGGQVVCWGPETHGVPKVVAMPADAVP